MPESNFPAPAQRKKKCGMKPRKGISCSRVSYADEASGTRAVRAKVVSFSRSCFASYSASLQTAIRNQ